MLDIFCQQLADTFWYWIYSANNWRIYSGIRYILPTIGRYNVNYGVFVRPSGAGLQIVLLLKCASFFNIFCNPTPTNWHISPNCWQNISNTNILIQLTYIPQLLSEYIQYQYINSTNIYSSIVGRIHPIQTYRFNLHIFPNYWQNISNTKI